jgi:hypothetical protein
MVRHVFKGGWSAMVSDTREQTAHDKAVAQLKKRRDFRGHLLIYVLVNAFLVVIWAITDRHGFFWPVFFIGIWGIAVVMNAWDVYWRPQFTEEDIQREIEREEKRS